MNPTRIALKGFTSHRLTDVHLNGERLVTAVGANGAGKSSLFSDALEFALFGVARGDRAEDLVQLGQSEMSVTLEFAFAGASYRVTRGRTTRSGGKPFLELAIGDGNGWRPLTGGTVRETQTALEQLLHLDHETFRHAVLLSQGDAHRFASATAGDRKKVLGQVLGLEVYQLAEAEARLRMRAAEAAMAGDRERSARLEERLADEAQHQDAIAHWTKELVDVQELTAIALTGREEAEKGLRDLAGRLAVAEAAQRDVERLTAQREQLVTRWRAAKQRRETANLRIVELGRTLEGEGAVEAAQVALDERRSAVQQLEADEARERWLRDQLRAAQDEVRDEERKHEAAVAAHTGSVASAKARVGELESLKGLDSMLSTCRQCGKRDACGHSADLVGRLEVARQELISVGKPPAPPTSIDRAMGKVARAESNIRELGFDAEALVQARRELLACERAEAGAGEIAQAKAALQSERAKVDDATAEMATCDADGKRASAELEEARTEAAAVTGVLQEKAHQEAVLQAAAAALTALEARRVEGATAIARSRAALDEIAKVKAELTELASRIEASQLLVERLRRLTVAFGVKGIPARIIESVLPELSGHANELLEQLRPGMRLDLRAQRAKRDGEGVIEALDLVVRDDVGERPLSNFSGGERMSVSLAIAVALSRLVARRSGSAIALLVVDEPEGLDLDSRRAFGQAIRAIAHRGELDRVLVVSHYADIADYADLVLEVRKVDGISQVEALAA